MRKGVDSIDTTFTKCLAGTQRAVSRFRACRFRFTASERKANICHLNRGILLLIQSWLNTRETQNGLRGSSIKNGKPFQTLE